MLREILNKYWNTVSGSCRSYMFMTEDFLLADMTEMEIWLLLKAGRV